MLVLGVHHSLQGIGPWTSSSSHQNRSSILFPPVSWCRIHGEDRSSISRSSSYPECSRHSSNGPSVSRSWHTAQSAFLSVMVAILEPPSRVHGHNLANGMGGTLTATLDGVRGPRLGLTNGSDDRVNGTGMDGSRDLTMRIDARMSGHARGVEPGGSRSGFHWVALSACVDWVAVPGIAPGAKLLPRPNLIQPKGPDQEGIPSTKVLSGSSCPRSSYLPLEGLWATSYAPPKGPHEGQTNRPTPGPRFCPWCWLRIVTERLSLSGWTGQPARTCSSAPT